MNQWQLRGIDLEISAFIKKSYDGDTVEAEEELTAGEANQFLLELHKLITSSGQSLNGVDLSQISQAVARYASGGIYFEDSGATTNAFVLAGVDNFVMPKAYFEGMTCLFRAYLGNDGAATVNVSGLGVKTIVDEAGNALAAGVITKGQFVALVYDGTQFVLPAGLNNSSYLNNPVFPEILTPNNVLALSSNAGQIVVDPGQKWLHRGWRKYSSDDYSAAERSFATQTNKTYHLRWTAAGGFVLKDLTDAGYNPGDAAEASSGFDSTYDDMLIGRIVTDAANVATVTSLVNKSSLNFDVLLTANSMVNHGLNSSNYTWFVSYNLARKPLTRSVVARWENVSSPDNDFILRVYYETRYDCQVFMKMDYATYVEAHLIATA